MKDTDTNTSAPESELVDGPDVRGDSTGPLAPCERCGAYVHEDGAPCTPLRSRFDEGHVSTDYTAPTWGQRVQRGPLAGIDLLTYCRTGQRVRHTRSGPAIPPFSIHGVPTLRYRAICVPDVDPRGEPSFKVITVPETDPRFPHE